MNDASLRLRQDGPRRGKSATQMALGRDTVGFIHRQQAKRRIMADEKAAALTNALAQIERQFGKGSIMKMGEFSDKMAFDVISSGSIALDLALGVGGFPRGRIIEIYGPKSTGKPK